MGRLVTVVLITWNSAPYLRRCLDGLAGQTYRDLELIHVDNASTDESVARVRERFPDCKQIVNAGNRGFAAAANQAIRIAHGELIALCNPDAYLTSDYIAKIIDALDRAGEKFGSATGTLIRARGYDIEPTQEIDSMGMRMTRTGRHLDITKNEERRTDNEVFGVSGAAALYRRTFINDVTINDEYFDEDFFAYREDADVAWRGRLFGWRTLHVSEAIAYHVRTVTPERRRSLPAAINMHSVKNRFLLRLKNEGFYLALRNAPFELSRDLITIGAVLTIERSSLPALRWLWRNRRRILEKRRAIQRRRRVSDRALAEWFR
ncbi:MAG: glycosyltransferase family 2 protein [Acidobacteria bacterium]|nr:MAG: glycosyltransferase family 2 protein [Acidobacteriota bacterium]